MAKNALLAEYTAAPGPGPDPATEPTNRILPGDGCSMQYRVQYIINAIFNASILED